MPTLSIRAAAGLGRPHHADAKPALATTFAHTSLWSM
jgi:hypothetical protein